jgi:hypothetical protein
MEPEKENWWNLAKDEKILFAEEDDLGHEVDLSSNGETGPRPYESRVQCREACVRNATCLTWQYFKNGGNATCAISGAFRYGHSVRYAKHLEHISEAVAGYMIDRLRAIRELAPCDAISSSDQDRSEGWFYREKSEHKTSL